ncbi:MAG TPA: cobalamin-binding protein [Steroidobacteraceae bacterium]|nr:cobalamin-binding protein [Steroidobacteraceae bacterium]
MMTIVDDTGDRVTVPYPPQRIVSLAPGATEMLFAVGAGDRVVATDDLSDEPPAARKLPKLGELANIDVERLIATKPAVVVVWSYGTSAAQIALLGRLGLPVYREESLTLDGIAASMRRLGRLAGTSAVADRVADALQARLAALTSRYGQARSPPTALLEVWDKPLYTVGGREPMSDALRVCGARNVFGDLQQAAPAVSVEAVIARNPDIIIAAAPPGKGAAWLASWRRFPMLRAVRNKRLIAFDDQRLSGLGPGAIEATAELCKRLAAL